MAPGLATLALSANVLVASATEQKTPKHVVFFLIDDYGFADASYKSELYEGTAPPPTPHMDALAKGGIRLESYYVHQLCSPTRTALLSGRYAYSIGQEDGVITNGAAGDMPLNLLTVADHLQQAGWNTAAFGKWDVGMTVWGSTPTCRGFDHFYGFYNAFNDYYTHKVGKYLDLRDDEAPVPHQTGVYSVNLFTEKAEEWIEQRLAEDPNAKTFSFISHQAVHGPMEVPQHYVDGACTDLVPEDHVTRRIYCGMVRAVDESVHNVTETYKKLGIWEDTLVILSSDNGGSVQEGGSNFPLRGQKATVWEGGVRAMGWIHGAGLSNKVIGSVNHELLHVTDWLPTIAQGIAGADLSNLGRDCPTCTTPVMPLDGFNQWNMLSAGQASARHEILLDLHLSTGCMPTLPHVRCNIPGQGAIRRGKWKLLHGFTTQADNPHTCAQHGDKGGYIATETDSDGAPVKITYEADASEAQCVNGWMPPAADPLPPPDVSCPSLPCSFENSTYILGGTHLFDVVADPGETKNVAAQFPEVVEKLLARLQTYNATHIEQESGLKKGPESDPENFGNVWTPWRGNPDPSVCDTNKIVDTSISVLV